MICGLVVAWRMFPNHSMLLSPQSCAAHTISFRLYADNADITLFPACKLHKHTQAVNLPGNLHVCLSHTCVHNRHAFDITVIFSCSDISLHLSSSGISRYVDVAMQLLEKAGDFVSEDIWHRVVQLVTNNASMQQYAARNVVEVLKRGAAHEVRVCVWRSGVGGEGQRGSAKRDVGCGGGSWEG